MGNHESHFNVSLIVRDKVTRQCPQTTNVFEEKGEPKHIRTEVSLLTSLTPFSLGQPAHKDLHARSFVLLSLLLVTVDYGYLTALAGRRYAQSTHKGVN